MRRRKLEAVSASASASEAAVLGNEDLLREILVRLDHPTCLVHAALVSRRWLRHASDPAFLRRFRGLHPPRLLGLYVHKSPTSLLGFFMHNWHRCSSRFVPLPHPRELDVVFRHVPLPMEDGTVLDCREGRLLVFQWKVDMENHISSELSVCSPLHRTPQFRVVCSLIKGGAYFFLPEDGGDGTCYAKVKLVCSGTRISVQHVLVRPGGASEVRTSATIDAPSQWLGHMDSALLVNKNWYILGDTGYILGLDVASMCLRVINLPGGIEHEQHANRKNITLCGANGSGFHLIHFKGFMINVWHHDDTDDAGGWQLVDTVCVRQAIAHLVKSDFWESTLKYGSRFLSLHRIADRAEFLLNMGREFFHMYIGSKKVEKLLDKPLDHDSYYQNPTIHPIMMVWPPRFPALRDEQVHQAQDD